MKKITAEQLLTAALLSGFMSLVIAALATWHAAAGTALEVVRLALGAWVRGWFVAFPLVLVAAPLARRAAAALLAKTESGSPGFPPSRE